MTSLYRFASDLAILERISDEETIELSQEELVGLIKNKVDSFSDYCRFIGDRISAIENRVDELNSLKEKETNKLKRLHKYAHDCLDILDVKSLEGVDSKISIAKNPPKVNILNEDLINPIYLTTKIVETTTIDKKALLNDLKNGAFVEGAELVQTTRLVIK